jgi:plasmid maintenance system antidote protein VapI
MKTFRDYLRSYFSKPNSLTINEVAELVGIHRVSLSRIVNGHAEPTLPHAAAIAEATGTRLSRILKKSELSA